jgi:hypothetical protein
LMTSIMCLSAPHRLSQSYEHSTPSSLPTILTTAHLIQIQLCGNAWKWKKEQQWLGLVDYLINTLCVTPPPACR